MDRFDTFNLVPGLTCNLACAHCVNESGPDQRGGISQAERDAVVDSLNSIRPATILLTGGEPTAYIESINDVLGRLTYRPSVILTTNGTYAETLEAARAKLDRLKLLNMIQLSFDPYHGSTLDSPLPRVLKEYAQEKGLEFVVTVSISGVADLSFACEVERIYGVRVIIQKIEGSGRAQKTGVEFRYEAFDPAVLGQVCPNASALSYIPRTGFTVCCSNVVYNAPAGRFGVASHDGLEENAFHNEVTRVTFGERLAKAGLKPEDLEPRHSSACNLCEFIVQKTCPSNSLSAA